MMELAEHVLNLGVALQETTGSSSPALEKPAAAAIGIGLAALGSGYAERGIGAAAIGALAEDSISTGIAILMTVLPETLVILALVPLFVG
ncbi:F0F1 ATP synthase subunit C [Halorubellus litoreus]|jgi:V/A-type H+-transporting ATPase subunit K|uniref:V-ATPase proteolipid subunit C-like domain-containing protein n=1 Tax=Halorubellus litoreus TaxID=755308 RepID=A0ABD5V9E3_9EURY